MMSFQSAIGDQPHLPQTDPAKLAAQIARLEEAERYETNRCQNRLALWQEVREGLTGTADPFRLATCLAELAALGAGDNPALDAARDAVSAMCHEYLLDFGERLRQACQARGLRVTGHFPQFTVEQLLRLEVDAARRQVRIGDSEVLSTLAIEPVVEVVAQDARRLLCRPFDASAFLELLQRAYRLALADQNRTPGDNIRLQDVHRFTVLLRQPARALKGKCPRHFVAYPVDEFAIDLGKLLGHGRLTTADGSRARLGFVRNTQKGMAILNPASQTVQTYGFLAFVRENEVHHE